MNDGERRLVSRGQATFRRFVSACNRRDGYRLELGDAGQRRMSCDRQVVLGRRLVVLDEEIDHYQAELTKTERRLQGMDR